MNYITKLDWVKAKANKQQPYMPKVGEECEWSINGDTGPWNYGFYLGDDIKGQMVLQGKGCGFTTVVSKPDFKFIPIQTQEEKDREFHHSVIGAILEQNDVEVNKACMNDIIDHIIKTTK